TFQSFEACLNAVDARLHDGAYGHDWGPVRSEGELTEAIAAAGTTSHATVRRLTLVPERDPRIPYRMRRFGTVRRRLDDLLWALLPGVCILCDSRSGATADLCEHCR